MRELPSGMVTFVFSDIEGSTRIFRSIGDRYPALLLRHHEILRAAWARFGGAEVKTEGDAFLHGDAGSVIQTTPLSTAQAGILDACGVTPPPRITALHPT